MDMMNINEMAVETKTETTATTVRFLRDAVNTGDPYIAALVDYAINGVIVADDHPKLSSDELEEIVTEYWPSGAARYALRLAEVSE